MQSTHRSTSPILKEAVEAAYDLVRPSIARAEDRLAELEVRVAHLEKLMGEEGFAKGQEFAEQMKTIKREADRPALASRTCPDCGSENLRGARYCAGCGNALEAL